MFDIVFKDAVIKDGISTFEGDLAVKGEHIAAIGRGLSGKQEIGLKGKWLLPGAIDVHTHMSLPFAGAVSADDFLTGTRAAAFGGVTTIIDFLSQRPGEGIRESFSRRLSEAEGRAVIDFSFHACIGDWNDRVKEDLPWAFDQGLTSLKVFTAYKKAGLMLDDGEFFEMLEATREVGILPTVHAESGAVIDRMIDRLGAIGQTSMSAHIDSHPVFTETEAVQRICHLAKAANSPVYIVHLSCGDSVPILRREQRHGTRVLAETCPQYLLLTDELLKSVQGHLFSCTPPLRPYEQPVQLWEGLADGTIQVLATDHCPFNRADKDSWNGDFRRLPMGLPGVETLLPLTLGKCLEFNVSPDTIIRSLTSIPARIFGLYPRKGSLLPGADADVIVFNPKSSQRITAETLHGANDYSVFEGWPIQGKPEQTYSHGRLMTDQGKFLGQAGTGRFLPRLRSQTIF